MRFFGLSVIFPLIISVLCTSCTSDSTQAIDPTQASDPIKVELATRSYNALQCVSLFGIVSDVLITSYPLKDGVYNITGEYYMVGFWGRALGKLTATADESLNLTYMLWEEQNDTSEVSKKCLNIKAS